MDDATKAKLDDRTPWTLPDIVRELGLSPREAADAAYRRLSGEVDGDPCKVLPSRDPGAEAPGRWTLLELRRIARGESDLTGPQWPAGAIRLWGLRSARIDRQLQIIPQRPVSTRRRGTPGWSH